jgi:hypothetical protein
MTVSAHPDGRARVDVRLAHHVWAIFRQGGVNLPTHPKGLRAPLDGGAFSPWAASRKRLNRRTPSWHAPASSGRSEVEAGSVVPRSPSARFVPAHVPPPSPPTNDPGASTLSGNAAQLSTIYRKFGEIDSNSTAARLSRRSFDGRNRGSVWTRGRMDSLQFQGLRRGRRRGKCGRSPPLVPTRPLGTLHAGGDGRGEPHADECTVITANVVRRARLNTRVGLLPSL